jgi:hypothetical protein
MPCPKPIILLLTLLALGCYPAFGATVTITQCGNCGNPGQALQITTTGIFPGTIYDLGFVNTQFEYLPSSGAITGIDATLDRDVTAMQSSNFSSVSLAANFRPLIEQNGNFYLGNITGTTLNVDGTNSGTTGWFTISGTGLTASSFTLFNFATNTFGVGNPDFTLSGAPVFFGFASLNSLQNASWSNGTLVSVFDNLGYTLSDPTSFSDISFNLNNYQLVEYNPNNIAINLVPEPVTIFLFLPGLGILWSRRKSFLK